MYEILKELNEEVLCMRLNKLHMTREDDQISGLVL